MKERKALFRSEVVAHRSQQSFSVPMDFHHGLLSILFWLLTIVMIFGLALLALVSYRETETAVGILQPSNGSQKIVAPTASMVKQVMVREGQSVDKGQILVALSSSRFDYAGKLSKTSQIQQLQSQQFSLHKQIEVEGEIQQQASAGRLALQASLLTSVEIVDTEAQLLELQLDTSERALDSIALLLESASASQAQYDQQHSSHLGLLRQQQEIAQRRQQLSRQRDELMAQQLQSELHFKQGQLESLNRLELFDYEIETLSHQEVFTVIAEADGVVAAIAIEAGQPVATRQLLLHIIPPTPNL
jgi:membrane fusion protein